MRGKGREALLQKGALPFPRYILLRQIRTDGGDRKSPVRDAADRAKLIRKLAEFPGLSFEHQNLQAIMMIQMHMKRRHDKPVRVVLPFRQLAGQIADMMIVNQAQNARRVRGLGMQRILHQRVTDDVAQRLGTAWASLPFAQGIKLLKQIAIQRNAETNRFSHCRTLYR